MKLAVTLLQVLACLFLISSEAHRVIAAKLDNITQPPITSTMVMSSSNSSSADSSTGASTDDSTDASTGGSTDASMNATMDASTDASTNASTDASTDASTNASTDASTDAPADSSTMTSMMVSSTIASTGAATLPTSANTVAFECPSLVVDVFADPDNCHRFYFCVFGTKLSLECDDYKLYNPYTRSCDVVDCNIGPSCLCV